MEYLSHEHRIMRFIAKVKHSGVVTFAHVKFMKPIGNDYAILKDRKVETTPYTDAEFDEEKVKAIFVERGYMAPQDFDTACATLKTGAYMKSGKFEAEEKAIEEHDRMEKAQKSKIDKEISDKRNSGALK